jgi:hypothetical protein
MRKYDITNINDILLEASYLPYCVYGINIRDINRSKPYGIIKNDNIIKDCIFKVKVNIKQDIYNLYCDNDGNDHYYGVAYIPDYKTSVFMNSLFRNIKENKNLDLLEESDDDEEFENINENKFVDLNKTVLLQCSYVEKVRKWKPIKIVNENELNNDNNTNTLIKKIVTKNELHEMMKNLINETKDNCNRHQVNKNYNKYNNNSNNSNNYNNNTNNYNNYNNIYNNINTSNNNNRYSNTNRYNSNRYNNSNSGNIRQNNTYYHQHTYQNNERNSNQSQKYNNYNEQNIERNNKRYYK